MKPLKANLSLRSVGMKLTSSIHMHSISWQKWVKEQSFPLLINLNFGKMK